MRMRCLANATAVILLVAPSRSLAGEPTRIPTPIDDLGEHVLASVTGTSLLWFAGAGAVTVAMSTSGGDHSSRVFIQSHFASAAWSNTATYAGYLVPIVVAPTIWIGGAIAHDSETAGAGAAVLQALVTTTLLTGILKVVTGRPYPINDGDPNAPDRLDHPDYARVWKPFSLHNRFAWPSGHMVATMSMVSALTAYYQIDRVWIPLMGYPIAFAIGAGMLSGDRHWTSDIIAGAFIAHAIGWSIGRSFRARRSGESTRIFVVPLLAADAGLAVVGEL